MDIRTLPLKTDRLNIISTLFKNDIVFTSSLLLALASCFIATPSINYINFKVLACLFNLMIVVKAFEEIHLLDKFAVTILNKCTDSRKVSLTLVLLSFFTSMLVTNDIALITLIPLALIIRRKSNINILVTVILQTLAANIGSSLTPMGNPQNLFIFSYYKLTASQFLGPITLFVLAGLVWLYILNYKNHNFKLSVNMDTIKIKSRISLIIWIVLFIIIVLSVFGIFDYKIIVLLTLTVTLIMDRKLISKVDYPLLITFICFFIFIGNISSIPAINSYMKSSLGSSDATYFSSIILSQFISNVPCSIFLSKFTSHWQQLLLGVNIGGMGTMIASMASLISYKLFIKENAGSEREYIWKFSLYNLLSLILFTFINYFTYAHI